MEEKTNMLEEFIILAKKYGYTVSDYLLDEKRVEIGLLKDAPKDYLSKNFREFKARQILNRGE